MVALLWAHVPVYPVLALGYGVPLWHALLEGAIVAVFGVCCVLYKGSRRSRALLVTFSLLSCSAILTHIMQGAIEAHFHFFVMVTVLALYQDWVPFLAAIGYVLLHHGLGSAFAHDSIFNHGGSPWKWAAVHAFFIAGLSAANIVNWRAAERMRDEVEARADDLARSNRELEEFAYVASHDLAEPLRMISSYLQLLDRRAELDEETRRYLEYAFDGAGRMHHLIDDLLRYSRAGRVDVKRRTVPAADVVADTMRTLAETIAASHATIEVGDLPTVEADPILLSQVFQNLVANAVKFHDGEAPRVRVSGRVTPLGWEFSVEDNGIGVSADDGERIFKMFQRLHHREDFDGTGIGLSVCQRIVERHGGEIHVEPAASGHGSRFVFTLSAAGGGNGA
jgi:signal transduction histidine kinase